MKKYIIYTVSRTGSILYANLISNYLKSQNEPHAINFSKGDDYANWSCPVHHTHQLELFDSAPDDFIRVLSTRSILDSAISLMVAEHTAVWSLVNRNDREQYARQFANTKIKIDPIQFADVAQKIDGQYLWANYILDTIAGEKYVLDYNTHAMDYNKLYTHLGLEAVSDQTSIRQSLPMLTPIDKFSMIENLKEIVDLYQSLTLEYDYNDQGTIARIQNYLKDTA